MAYNLGNERKIKTILENKQSYDSFTSFYSNYINFIDFLDGNKRFYGIKNKNNLEILPKADKILFDDEYGIVALDFVIFAYKQLVEKYYSLVLSGQINKNSIINKSLSKPYMSQVGLDFEPIVKENTVLFNNLVTTNIELNLASINIKNYVNCYVNNIQSFKNSIQTHMKYYNSYALRNVSGLSITLLNLPFNNDQEKVDFLSDPNFLVLRKLTEQYGFYIDKNIPWQITANLSHPNIKSIVKKIYPSQKDITVDFIIEQYFDILLFIDYEKQKEFFYNAYTDLYNFRDQFSEAYYCGNKQKTILKHITRESPPKVLEDFLKFEETFFLKSYLKLLNSENNFKYNVIELNKLSNKMLSIYNKNLDKHSALVYIYGKF